MSHHHPQERIRSLSGHPARLIQHAFDQSHNGMVITDATGHIVLANEAFCRIAGCERREATGWPIEHFFASLRTPMPMSLDDAMPHAWQQEVLCRHADGESHPVLMTVDALPSTHDQATHFLRTFVNLITSHSDRPSTHHWVHVDPTTGLPNWLLLRDRLSHALAHAERTDHGLALLFIDVDRFKAVNDAVGHIEGDRLLGDLARRMQGALRNRDTLARLGGDEFVMILDGSAEAAQIVAERLQEALEPPFAVENGQLLLTVSIGIALFPFDAEDEEGLINGAQGAMLTARQKGPGRLAFVDHRLTAQLKEKFRLECQLSEAAHAPEKHFAVHYQPEFDPRSGACIGLEARLYWHQPHHGWRSPETFRDAANRLGLGVRLDRWALLKTIDDHHRWQADASPLGMLTITLPLSESHLAHNTFDGRPLDRFLRQHHPDPLTWLTLAIPSQCLGLKLEDAAHLLKRLVTLGVRLTVDDLGDGAFDLARLARLPLHRARFRASLARESQRSLAAALCRLLEALAIEPGVTHVDTLEDALAIEALSLPRVQGEHYGLAMSTQALDDWLGTQNISPSA
ncbi:GGDEF and EAL domain-containing protein [Billgrantia gudaonensis]|uniref:PAS domain S-box-containing protein/diguanylate cyclase (GGDEF) domain-containing protein n=1 Tax=Billgrantia gudaonensis TaxID=376427 RepID=A0A1G8T4C4_9GAMM|nr:GGDEF and EAL domain-containing protein [Halomonas gudaonensis]SDJ36333.1 PAS domain S-box-containing protein/diguanylate cyclase (GGDEF) domain-containing protein [Halomonas gudaonensis]